MVNRCLCNETIDEVLDGLDKYQFTKVTLPNFEEPNFAGHVAVTAIEGWVTLLPCLCA